MNTLEGSSIQVRLCMSVILGMDVKKRKGKIHEIHVDGMMMIKMMIYFAWKVFCLVVDRWPGPYNSQKVDHHFKAPNVTMNVLKSSIPQVGRTWIIHQIEIVWRWNNIRILILLHQIQHPSNPNGTQMEEHNRYFSVLETVQWTKVYILATVIHQDAIEPALQSFGNSANAKWILVFFQRLPILLIWIPTIWENTCDSGNYNCEIAKGPEQNVWMFWKWLRMSGQSVGNSLEKKIHCNTTRSEHFCSYNYWRQHNLAILKIYRDIRHPTYLVNLY